MPHIDIGDIPKRPRIDRLIAHLFAKPPEIEAARAVLLTASYRQTEGEPMVLRRAKAFEAILEGIPIIIRPEELIVGSATLAPRGCQTFPEFSYAWLESELDTIATRSADPFAISEETKAQLRTVFPYWKGRTSSELARSYMLPQTLCAMEHNIFTPGNYFYHGVGHITVHYDRVVKDGLEAVIGQAQDALRALTAQGPKDAKKRAFLEAVVISNRAVIAYAKRYAALAEKEAASCQDATRRAELEAIAIHCSRVPAQGARTFAEACQSFWFIQMLLQIESSGHSISPGRLDQYLYPFYAADLAAGRITREHAQELVDCIFVKLNDLNKARDADSSEGFAGYSLFQNLIAGGQTSDGHDATNDVSIMCLEAAIHVALPQPSLSVRVWNGSPQAFLRKAAMVTRTGIGLPAYYNDEVIIPSLLNRGLSMEDARDYGIIGCVEPQKAGKTEGWHDAAFFNMCRPLELVFSSGEEGGDQVGPRTQAIASMTSFDEFWNAYRLQMDHALRLLVNADNAIDLAHAERCPLPFESSLVEDCIARGTSLQDGGAVYNFTGPQGFGVANVADSLYAVKTLVFDEKYCTLPEYKQALDANFGQPGEALIQAVANGLRARGLEADIGQIRAAATRTAGDSAYAELLRKIETLPRFGNDVAEVDTMAREAAYLYSRPLETFENPRGGHFQAGLYPVSANVPLGAQTGATPDGRLAGTPVADGVSPAAGRDTHGPTASANSVAKLDHAIASNGTLLNMKFHPSALAGREGLERFIAFLRGYFDQKGSHIQFNVVSRETLRDAQKHPENYRSLVVRVAGYSALFTTLSRALQEDIINRTEQGSF